MENEDLVDMLETAFDVLKWDLDDSGTYLDNLQDEVDSRLEDSDYPDSFDVREDYEGDDGYDDYVDNFREKFQEIADIMLQNDSIDWDDEAAVDNYVDEMIEDFDEDFHQIEIDSIEDAASRIVDSVLSHWDDDQEEEDDSEDEE